MVGEFCREPSLCESSGTCGRAIYADGMCFAHAERAKLPPHLRESRGRIPNHKLLADREVRGVIMRFCRHCSRWKVVSRFERRPTGKLGHSRRCKQCACKKSAARQRQGTKHRRSRAIDQAIEIVESAKNRAETLRRLHELKETG